VKVVQVLGIKEIFSQRYHHQLTSHSVQGKWCHNRKQSILCKQNIEYNSNIISIENISFKEILWNICN
jgi:hypothetical protein